MNSLLRNLKIKYKLLLIFVVLFGLMLDLGALNIATVDDARSSTDRIANQLVPRLIETSKIKDNLNISILAAYEYVQTGNSESKTLYEEKLDAAIVAQIELFFLSRSETDFEFTNSFQDHINSINTSLEELITIYEAGASQEEIEGALTNVSNDRDAFSLFLDTEIQDKVQLESVTEQERSGAQMTQTILNVGVVGIIAIVSLILLFLFVRRSITKPVAQLTEAAQQLGNGNFEEITLDSNDELGLFAQTFNTMATDIQNTQNALEVELAKTKQLDKQKTEFLSIAAHQLRTPMSGIKWVVNMAVEGDFGSVSKEAKEQLGNGLENIDRMITLINSLLDVTRIEADEMEYEFNTVSLTSIITSAAEGFSQAAEAKKVTVTVDDSVTHIPEVKVDEEKIALVFQNLIDNGIKYTPEGGTVTVNAKRKENIVLISIQDSGYGIPQKEQERIFSKFFRGSNIQTVQADGSGLGLFLVHEIVHQHGGEISFISEEGKGTTFTVALPVNGPSKENPAAHSAAGIDPEKMTINVEQSIQENRISASEERNKKKKSTSKPKKKSKKKKS